MRAELLRFFKSSKEEKHMKVSRIFYSIIHKKQFAEIGRHSFIVKPILCSNRKYIHIGKNVCIWNGARIECIVSWKGKKITPSPCLRIEDGCGIGQNIHLTCAGIIKIEECVNIAPDVLITNINHSFNELSESPLEKDLEISDVIIGKYSFIGHGAKIMPGVHIGRNVIVGAGSIVTHNVDDYCIVAGNPARVIRKYNDCLKIWEKV